MKHSNKRNGIGNPGYAKSNTSIFDHHLGGLMLLIFCLLINWGNSLQAQHLNYRQTIDNGFGIISAATVSPDGKHVYVAAPEDGAIVVYARDDATGRLSIVEGLFDHGEDGAGNTISYLSEPHKSAVSPDGNQVYFVSAGEDDALIVFNRNSTTGTLTFLESVHNGGQDRFGTTVNGLAGARAIVISPDGKHIYVAGPDETAIAVLNRETSTGRLSFVESIQDDDIDYQGNTTDGLRNAIDLVLSPDGQYLYVAAPGDNSFVSKKDNAVGVFKRDASTGRLSFVQTLKDGQKDPNGTIVDGLDQDFSIAISPDGLFIYMASKFDDAVAVFQRNTITGMLSFVKAFKNNGKDHAGQTITGLNGIHAVAVSTDGRYLYAANNQEDGIVIFSRIESTGKLTLLERLDDGGTDDLGNNIDGLEGAFTIALSPDGKHVYICAYEGTAISTFEQLEAGLGYSMSYALQMLNQDIQDQFEGLIANITGLAESPNNFLDERYKNTLIRKIRAAKAKLSSTQASLSVIMLKTFKRQFAAAQNVRTIPTDEAQNLIDLTDTLITSIQAL